jgi:hypothetical protein
MPGVQIRFIEFNVSEDLRKPAVICPRVLLPCRISATYVSCSGTYLGFFCLEKGGWWGLPPRLTLVLVTCGSGAHAVGGRRAQDGQRLGLLPVAAGDLSLPPNGAHTGHQKQRDLTLISSHLSSSMYRRADQRRPSRAPHAIVPLLLPPNARSPGAPLCVCMVVHNRTRPVSAPVSSRRCRSSPSTSDRPSPGRSVALPTPNNKPLSSYQQG